MPAVPPRWILEPTDKAFAQGSDAKVECKADGFPRPQVTWKRAAGKKHTVVGILNNCKQSAGLQDGAAVFRFLWLPTVQFTSLVVCMHECD